MKRALAAMAAAGALVLLAGCAGSGGGDEESASELTMWVRPDGSISQALVDEYNATHDTQIKLTVVPGDSYLQKVATAAGSNSLPDLLASDVVYAPNYVDQGLYQDLTDRIEELPFVDSLVPSHLEAASKDGQMYAVPHIVDNSLILYNKDLYVAAGLDPEVPPTSFDEMYEQAKAIRDSAGGDTYGFYFAGNCGGCNLYTLTPYLAAADEPPLMEDGAVANLDTQPMRDVMDLYQRMYEEGIAPTSSANEDGSTWTAGFVSGSIGILPAGSFVMETLRQEADFEWGVAPLPAPDGASSSSFVGGDVIGVTRSSKNIDAAWDFIQWSLSDEAQVDVLAKIGTWPVRVDLADNEYTSKDPRSVEAVEMLADGYTAKSLKTGEIFNESTGPWTQNLRAVIVNGEDSATGSAALQESVQKLLDD
ncbi:carbohydrate ABC transporter substrate-binding protein, CUT1 family [Microbacterium sp. RU33B]|nr:carbohydrate ABC transporter substrate-binding protein, CUT1 family [Microbacterium sp. RU33B]